MTANVKTRILFHSRRLNIYLVRYPQGHKIVPHVDMVSAGRLFKLNCVLVKPKAGGEFLCEKHIFNLFGRVVLFRPDLHQHRVSTIENGNRWLLSFAFNTQGTA
ncbi:2-oxoglutarate-Fe(II)-dependent oxygenase superfamily protein [Tamilnaduibacter salinus]|uniref:2-oxoglutarate-Fe(II)-dependent oxygenase superfamily protein n=1 Tax=Tamilnaduibacter salinus TaxID=1484056 RepID=A0A2U1CTT9_9GAMM|nr:2OG-Fe(II) oxygenase [Tamilnaduibacter salinus]PVY70035.1 2-oxoglutarate-Fe(II)-dependent oxygenase superfamily protein [Tamilnaduibacter salinus]